MGFAMGLPSPGISLLEATSHSCITVTGSAQSSGIPPAADDNIRSTAGSLCFFHQHSTHLHTNNVINLTDQLFTTMTSPTAAGGSSRVQRGGGSRVGHTGEAVATVVICWVVES